jgi:2-dehydro-3-deoxyphosphogluconate aldolase / (4S)-4-hydroxy-2-oxoglutarate aldolase
VNRLGVDEFADLLRAAVVLPVLRAPDRTTALEQVERCVAAGLPLVELTATTPDWVAALHEVRRRWPWLPVGVGTVLELGQAEAAVEARAAFLVSPCPVPDVRRVVNGRLPLLEGGFTPAELLEASARGVAKLFPAHVAGPGMLRSVLALRPQARIVPTGGVALADVPCWLEAGALAVGVGAALLDEPDLTARIRVLQAGQLSRTT